MKQLELTKEERENIRVLINIGKSILETERKIIELEVYEQHTGPEYQSVINSLESTLALEENLLSKLFSSSDRIIAFFMEYGDPLNTNDISKQLETFINPTEDKLAITRIINYFFNKIIYDKNGNNQLQGVAINYKTREIIQINPDAILQLEEIIKSDIIYTILNLLNTEIKHCQKCEVKLKRLLTQNKYNLLFMFPNIEKQFLTNPNTFEDLYISNKFVAEYYKIFEDLYHSILFKTTKPLFNLSVSPLANMSSIDFKNKKAQGIIYSILLRTCLIINDKDFYNKLKEQITYHTIILNKPNTEGINHIFNILERVKIDKEIPKTITLARKKED